MVDDNIRGTLKHGRIVPTGSYTGLVSGYNAMFTHNGDELEIEMEEGFRGAGNKILQPAKPTPVEPEINRKETKMTDLTVHDAWLDLLKVRKDDLIALVKTVTSDDKLGVDDGKFSRAVEQLDIALDGIEAQVLVAQRAHLMEQKKF